MKFTRQVKKNNDTQIAAFDAWIVFSAQADLPWLKILKSGFRHCSLLINDGQSWMSIDPMLHHTDICMHHHVESDFDLAAWYRSRGHVVIKAPVLRDKIKPAPIMPISCVEVIKRILGYHSMLIFTPWQLYKYVLKLDGQSKNKNANFQDISNQDKSMMSKGDLSWEV